MLSEEVLREWESLKGKMLGVIQKLPRTNLSDELKSQINSFIASEDERIPLPEQLLTDLSDLYHARYY